MGFTGLLFDVFVSLFHQSIRVVPSGQLSLVSLVQHIFPLIPQLALVLDRIILWLESAALHSLSMKFTTCAAALSSIAAITQGKRIFNMVEQHD